MFKINRQKALIIILLFALINSSIFIGLQPNSILRLVIALLMNISGFLLIIYFIKISKRKFDTNLYFKIMFFLVISWSLYTVFRSFTFDSKTLITLFGHYLMGWAWLTPLAVVFGFNIFNWFIVFNFFSKLLFFGSVLALGSFFYPSVVFGLLEWMAFLPVMLLTYFYQNKINKKIVILTLISFLILSFFASQRANFVFLFIVVSFFIFEFYRQSEIKIHKKVFSSLILIIGSLLLVLQLSTLVTKLATNKDIQTDTRTFLFVELFADMSDEELLVGRGALGTYFSPYFYHWNKYYEGGDSSTRSVNEVAYLEMILKGGYVMMILYLLILLPAAYLGIFKSSNIIARMSGYLILSYIILWAVSYYPVYSAEYIILWMAAGTAISSNARNIKNRELLIRKKGRLVFAKK